MELLYRKKFPDAPEGEPPPEVAAELLAEIRDRVQRIEQTALDMLRRETRNPPSRGLYSRHMQFFMLKVFFPLIGVAVAGYLLALLLKALF